MRRFLWLSMLTAGLVLSSPRLCSQTLPQVCDFAGRWYGGGEATKYLMTIIRGPGGEYTGTAEGAFSLDTRGFPVKTMWVGSIVKGRGKAYEMFSKGMVNRTSAFPAPSPEVQAVHATARLINCDTLKFDYDFFCAYFWPTAKKPFLSPPDYVVVPPPFSETYQRMPTTCTQCPKQSAN